MPACGHAAPGRNAERDRRVGESRMGGTDCRSSVRPPEPANAVRSIARARRQDVAWGYCHVPRASTVNILDHVEQQIERFASGFRDCVLARSVMRPADIEAHNANLVGGDIAAGVTDLRQFFTRPTWRNYSTPVKGLYLCSASTPPGG